MSQQPGRRGKQVTIVDEEAFVTVVNRLIDRAGSVVAAAKVLGLTEGALRTYRKPKRHPGKRAVNADTVDGLYAAFPLGPDGQVPEEWDLLDRAFLSEEAHLALTSYDNWLDPRTEAFAKRRTGRWARVAEGVYWIPAGDSRIRGIRLGELYYLIGLLLSKYPNLWTPLRTADKQYRPEHGRYMLAIIRIVEPLLEARESGFIEVGWEELLEEAKRQKRITRKALRRDRLEEFLAAGVQREIILMKRDSNEDRAYAAAQQDKQQPADPDWGELLMQRLQNAQTARQKAAWREAYNVYAVMANNLGIRKLDPRSLYMDE